MANMLLWFMRMRKILHSKLIPHPPPPPKTQEISPLLLTWFWWNFKESFLEQSLADSKYQIDICPVNIWPGDFNFNTHICLSSREKEKNTKSVYSDNTNYKANLYSNI